MRSRRSRWAVLAATSILALLVGFAHPYFAITRPSGAQVLVVEGWMHRPGLNAAMRLFNEGEYEHLYITGTLRPFSYHLLAGDGFTIRSNVELDGTILFDVTGLPGARWALLGDGDTLIIGGATTLLERHQVILPKGMRQLRFVETSAAGPQGVPVLYVGSMEAHGENMHAMVDEMVLHRSDGSSEPGWPTHAEQARSILLQEGMPDELISIVPDRATSGRTLASAHAFARVAAADGVTRFDVATLGVHARRSWQAHVQAWGNADGVGIISLPDPWCGRWTWWLNPYGWLQVMKELAAWPSARFPSTPT